MSRAVPLRPPARSTSSPALRLVLALLIAGAGVTGLPASPMAACSSMAPALRDVALSAQAIVRVETIGRRGTGADRRYDLKVVEVLKGSAPPVIRITPDSLSMATGVCEGGWFGGRPGDVAILFLAAPDGDGTLYFPRLWGRSWSSLAEGVAVTGRTVDTVRASIRRSVPGRRSMVPRRMLIVRAVDGRRMEPARDVRDATGIIRILEHRDGTLSFWSWRLGGRRIDRFVVRAGDLRTPGPVLFELEARNSDHHAWAVELPREAFRESAEVPTIRAALDLLRSGQVVVEVWPRRTSVASGPRVHGVPRATDVAQVAWTRQGGLRLVVDPIDPRALTARLGTVPWLGPAAAGSLIARGRAG